MYETYLNLWWERNEWYNTFVSLCNYFYCNTFGENDDAYILQFVADTVEIVHESMMKDFGVMEEKLRVGATEDEAGHLVCVGGAPLTEPVFHAEGVVVIEVEHAQAPEAGN